MTTPNRKKPQHSPFPAPERHYGKPPQKPPDLDKSPKLSVKDKKKHTTGYRELSILRTCYQ